MQNPVDKEFTELYEKSKMIIDKINQLMTDYKNIDEDLNLGFVNENFQNLLKTNETKCQELGEKILKNSQKFVIFGQTNAGKSSFINALAFKSDVLPIGSKSTTKCFVEIKQSPSNENCLIVNDQEKPFSELENIVTSENNRTSHVNLFYNFLENACFANNIIIDTPGTDFDEDYDENILQYCNEADVVILVVNASNNIGKSIKKFYEKFKNRLSNLNLYTVHNYCDVVQERNDFQDGIDENISILTEIFPTTTRKKMGFISSSERMEIIKKNKDCMDKCSKYRNDSFKELSSQLKNERSQISMIRRYGFLCNILELQNENLSCLSQMINEQLTFFNADFRNLFDSLLLKKKIKGLVSFNYETMKTKYRRIFANKCGDVRRTAGELLESIENELKEKIKGEIITHIKRNHENSIDNLIYIMNNIYFPKAFNEIHLVYRDNLERNEFHFGIGKGVLLMGVSLATMHPVYGITMGFGYAVGSIVNIILDHMKFNDLLITFGNELFNNISNFQKQTSKYADLANCKQQIQDQINEFIMRMESFKQKNKISSN